jgi:uncharacterized membrane protein
MKEWLTLITEYSIMLIDFIALAVVVYGTLEAFITSARIVSRGRNEQAQRQVWLRFARWLVAGLTFQLAADIIETAISTDWTAIGRIGAIALIRTFLNYFLDRDVTEIGERHEATARQVDS